MIIFNQKTKVFTLSTKNTAYAFGILGDKLLTHIYWGKKLKNEINENWADDFVWRSHSAFDYGDYSTNYIPLEYPQYGGGDSRICAFSARFSDGGRVTKADFNSFEILEAKPDIEGLPSVYAEKGDNVQTLVVTLHDDLKNLDILLYYSVFEDFDAITRSVKIINSGEKMQIRSVLSASVDFFGAGESDIIHLDGSWARERFVTRQKIEGGNISVESGTGVSSSYYNPFIAVCDRTTTELSGNAYGFGFVYSGNFVAGCEKNTYDTVRAYMGINPREFEWVLENGQSFSSPEVILAYSPEGLSGMSRIFHKIIRERVCKGKFRDIERYALINNWEATYFDISEEKIVNIAKTAKKIGIDTMVLDDGWFGNRVDEKTGLGDWVENPEILPNGIDGLCKKINDLGMNFGLWFEPEMVSPNSNLYKLHPDWIIHTKGRTPSKIRHQYTLDLSRKDVCDYVENAVGAILKKANIGYVKWDMNRSMSEVGSAFQVSERQGEVMHRYMLGLYSILKNLNAKFPNVLFEACASGGARFDCGILQFMPQVWTSDDTDAVERVKIQYGTSFIYPYASMGCHVSACPNHQLGRTTPFDMRCNVAIPGQFGFELDLNNCTEDELKTAKKAVVDYRRLGEVFHKGDLYRIRSPFDCDVSVNEFVSEDKNTVLVCIYPKTSTVASKDEYLKLAGLDETAVYECNGKLYGGDYLMNKGVHYINDREYKSVILEFKKK